MYNKTEDPSVQAAGEDYKYQKVWPKNFKKPLRDPKNPKES